MRVTRHTILPLILFLAISLFYLFSEKIGVNEGFGWDGVRYGAWASDISYFTGEDNMYYSVRAIPSLIASFFTSVIDLFAPPDYVPVKEYTINRNVIHGFTLLNICCLAISLYFWHRITAVLSLGERLKIASYLLLFINYFMIKEAAFCPVTTDYVAFSLTMASLYLYIDGAKRWLFLVLLVLTFVWPTTLLLAPALLLFPFDSHAVKASINPYFLLAGVLLICTASTYSAFLLPAVFHSIEVDKNMISLSFVACGAYLFLYYRAFTENKPWLHLQISPNTWRVNRILPVVLITVIPILLILGFGKNSASATNVLSPTGFILYNLREGVVRPVNFLVSHHVYYGAAIALVMINWKKIIPHIRQMGNGITVLFIALGLLSINSESRQLLQFYPLVIIGLLFVWKKNPPSNMQVAFLLLYNLMMSKFYISFGTLTDEHHLLSGNMQRYMKYHGPWMNQENYRYALAMLAGGLLFWMFALKRKG